MFASGGIEIGQTATTEENRRVPYCTSKQEEQRAIKRWPNSEEQSCSVVDKEQKPLIFTGNDRIELQIIFNVLYSKILIKEN